MKKVIAAGHICLDITPAFTGKKKGRIGDILQPGKLIEVGGATVSTGGAAANTGLGMKILGADVTVMAKIGEDAFGDIISSEMRKYGVEKGLIRSKDESTSYSVVLAVPGNDRVFLHNPGANHSFCAEDVPEELLREAALFHFGYPPLMRRMYENEGEELLKLFRKVKEAGCAISLDLAAVDPDTPAGEADWKLILEKVLPYVDFFVPSIEELGFMLDRERYQDWQKRAEGRDITEILSLDEDIRPLAEKSMALGAKVVLLKCGAPGLYYATSSKGKLDKLPPELELDTAAWADREGFEPSYVPDIIRSGTGAGDTSIAAFLTAMLNGETPEESVSLAAASGASCVTSFDALSGLKSLPELKAKIKAGWAKV